MLQEAQGHTAYWASDIASDFLSDPASVDRFHSSIKSASYCVISSAGMLCPSNVNAEKQRAYEILVLIRNMD